MYLEKENADLKRDNSALNNNIEVYKDQLAGADSVGHTLMLKLDDFKHSNDKMVHTLDSTLKVLKIDLKSVKGGTVINNHTEYNGEDRIIFGDSCNFSYVDTLLLEKSKGLSKLKIIVKGDSIKTNLTIDNATTVINYVKKEWVEPKFFKRLFTWNWKKNIHNRFVSVNTNPTIHNNITSIEIRNDNE